MIWFTIFLQRCALLVMHYCDQLIYHYQQNHCYSYAMCWASENAMKEFAYSPGGLLLAFFTLIIHFFQVVKALNAPFILIHLGLFCWPWITFLNLWLLCIWKLWTSIVSDNSGWKLKEQNISNVKSYADTFTLVNLGYRVAWDWRILSGFQPPVVNEPILAQVDPNLALSVPNLK